MKGKARFTMLKIKHISVIDTGGVIEKENSQSTSSHGFVNGRTYPFDCFDTLG